MAIAGLAEKIIKNTTMEKTVVKEKAKKVSKIIVLALFWGGAIAIATTSPAFVPKMMPRILRYVSWKIRSKKQKRKFTNAFYYLKNKGLLKIEYRGKQIYVSLTKEGRKKAGKYQIDDLKIKKPWRWDKKWRVLIFDVKEEYKDKREALRGKLKDLGLFQLQDSVWVCPYGFQKEIDILREFFGFNSGELKIIEASRIEGEDEIKHFFNLR